MDPPIPEKKDPPIITESHSTIEERMDPPDALELNGGAPAGENDNDNDGLDIHVNIARSVTGSAPTDIVHDHNNNNNDGSSSKLHPMEIEMESEEDDGDMESLLSSSGNPVSSQPKQKRMQQKPAKTYLNGWIKPQRTLLRLYQFTTVSLNYHTTRTVPFSLFFSFFFLYIYYYVLLL
jgi:hypothetical protein